MPIFELDRDDDEDIETEGAENRDDENDILSDKDEVGRNPAGNATRQSLEMKDMPEDFLAGRVDLVKQMERTVAAIQDALEAELRNGPQPESPAKENTATEDFDDIGDLIDDDIDIDETGDEGNISV